MNKMTLSGSDTAMLKDNASGESRDVVTPPPSPVLLIWRQRLCLLNFVCTLAPLHGCRLLFSIRTSTHSNAGKFTMQGSEDAQKIDSKWRHHGLMLAWVHFWLTFFFTFLTRSWHATYLRAVTVLAVYACAVVFSFIPTFRSIRSASRSNMGALTGDKEELYLPADQDSKGEWRHQRVLTSVGWFGFGVCWTYVTLLCFLLLTLFLLLSIRSSNASSLGKLLGHPDGSEDEKVYLAPIGEFCLKRTSYGRKYGGNSLRNFQWLVNME